MCVCVSYVLILKMKFIQAHSYCTNMAVSKENTIIITPTRTVVPNIFITP